MTRQSSLTNVQIIVICTTRRTLSVFETDAVYVSWTRQNGAIDRVVSCCGPAIYARGCVTATPFAETYRVI